MAAGLATVITTHRFTRGHDFSHAELVVNSAGEPDLPFIVAYGDVGRRRYIDVALLDMLLLAQSERAHEQAIEQATA